jgi:hypothetical protein
LTLLPFIFIGFDVELVELGIFALRAGSAGRRSVLFFDAMVVPGRVFGVFVFLAFAFTRMMPLLARPLVLRASNELAASKEAATRRRSGFLEVSRSGWTLFRLSPCSEAAPRDHDEQERAQRVTAAFRHVVARCLGL